MRFRFQELSDRLGGWFHNSVEHVNNSLASVVVGGNETDAVGGVDTSRSVVQVDADVSLAIFCLQDLINTPDLLTNGSVIMKYLIFSTNLFIAEISCQVSATNHVTADNGADFGQITLLEIHPLDSGGLTT